jgi:hypothetical protein
LIPEEFVVDPATVFSAKSMKLGAAKALSSLPRPPFTRDAGGISSTSNNDWRALL